MSNEPFFNTSIMLTSDRGHKISASHVESSGLDLTAGLECMDELTFSTASEASRLGVEVPGSDVYRAPLIFAFFGRGLPSFFGRPFLRPMIDRAQ